MQLIIKGSKSPTSLLQDNGNLMKKYIARTVNKSNNPHYKKSTTILLFSLTTPDPKDKVVTNDNSKNFR